MESIRDYQQSFLAHLKAFTGDKQPKNLYQPIDYILHLGGKRLRPVLTLMAAHIFQERYDEALNAALCVEVFHNFTLVHDDIMDAAPVRRGQITVHKKWDVNTAILSGDAMLILAYKLLENYDDSTFGALNKIFTKTALEVCEGQQHDIDFETRVSVTEDEYLKMIEYKTAVLVGAALKMGAIVANASKADQNAIYDFGRLLGIAFQLQDDYLDAFGDPKSFGKQVGGDIIENKKTYLYIKALEFADQEHQLKLLGWFKKQPDDPTQKIEAVKQIFENSGAKKAIITAVEDYTNKAFHVLSTLNASEEKKALLKSFGLQLMQRTV